MELGVKETTTFNQVESSVVAGSIDCGYRAYASHVQHGGELVSGILSIGTFGSGYGSFQQFGGSNSIGSLKIGNGTVFYGGYCYYQMCDGTLSSGEVQIGRGGYGGWFTQSGGLHTISGGLSLLGTVYITVPYCCGYTISNGTLHAASLTMSIASFTHLNSTTRFDGPVEIPGGWTRYSPATFFTVSGGVLSCSNFTSSDAELTVSAGTLLVSNTLSFSGAAYFSSSRDSMAGFEFSGDCLAARDMVINARMVVLDSSQAGRIQNPGKFTLGGWLRFGRADEQLGTLVVDKRFWDPEITFTASSAKLRFLSSAAEAWPCTRLSVSGWNGVPAGGQGTQLFVGTNRYGLTPTQLHGIRFVNPAGLAPGVYNAVILDTGEVVPTIRPFIESKAIDGALVLSWPTNCILQSATNVTGPYADWPQVVSPYTNSTLEGLSQFFRLRLR